jgi:hypothetical protein
LRASEVIFAVSAPGWDGRGGVLRGGLGQIAVGAGIAATFEGRIPKTPMGRPSGPAAHGLPGLKRPPVSRRASFCQAGVFRGARPHR